MTYANVGHILLKRGNTSQSNSYTGPVGELTFDTGLFAVRVHNGVTPGGNVLLENASQFTANLGAAETNITTLFANATTQTTLINAINANVTAANAAITSLTSNAAIQASLLDTLTGNAVTQAITLNTLTSNAATQATSLTTLLSNAATQQTSLTDLVANAAAQAQAIANSAGTYGNANVESYIGANIGSLKSNAATQATSINAITANIGAFYTYANINFGTSSYANANVAGYLASQNITSANIGGSQTYANTQVNTVSANLGSYQTYANANAATQATSLNTLNANLGAYQTYANLTFSTVANAATQQTEINALRANITAANTLVYNNSNVVAYLAGNVTVGNLTVANNAVILGNLRVLGTQTTVNTATLNVTDLYITVANAAVQASDANGAGIRVAGALANIAYSSISDSFEFNKPITANIQQAGNIAFADGTFMTTAALLGKFRIVDGGSTTVLVTTNDADGYGGYDIAIAPGGEDYSYIVIPKAENAALGDRLRIGATEANSAVQINTAAGEWTFQANSTLSVPPVIWNYVPTTFTAIPVTYGATTLTFTVLPDNTITNMSVAAGAGGYIPVSIDLTVPGTTFPGGATPANDIVFNVTTFPVSGMPSETTTSSVVTYVSGTLPPRYDNINSIDNIGVGAGSNHWTFGTDGELYLPTGGRIGATKGGTMLDGGFGSSTSLTSFYASGNYSACATGSANGNLYITTYNDGGADPSKIWSFDNNGILTFPTGMTMGNAFGTEGIQGSGNSTVGVLASGLSGAAALEWVNDYTSPTAFSAVVVNSLFAANTGAVQILTGNVDPGGAEHSWTFDSNGNLTLPSANFDASPAPSSSPLIVFPSTGYIGASIGTELEKFLINSEGQTWTFDGSYGDLTFPGGTVFSNQNIVVAANAGFTVTTFNGTSHFTTFGSDGNLIVPGDILPALDNLHDLGSATQRFRHLYVGPGTVYIGNAAIKSTATGNLILPGITRAVASSAYAEEVNDRGRQTYSFATTPTIIDNAQYLDLAGRVNGLSFTPAEYLVDQLDGEGFIDGITINVPGSGYSDTVADLAQQNMWATEVTTPLVSFNANDWIQIPFQVQSRAGESEYEFNAGGGDNIDLGKFKIATDGGNAFLATTDDADGYGGYNIAIAPSGESSAYITVPNNANAEIGVSLTIASLEANSSVRIQTDWSEPWTFNANGTITFPDSTVQTTAYTGNTGATSVTVGNTAFQSPGGSLWYNTNDGRLYVDALIDGTITWVDTSPAVIPAANIYLGDLLIDNRTVYSDLAGWTFGTDGNLTVPGNIIPDTTETHNLGSATNRWKDLYLSGNTINLGGSILTSTPIGGLKVLGGVVTGKSFNGFGSPMQDQVVSADRKTLTFTPPLQTGWTLEPTIKVGRWLQNQPTLDEPTFSWMYGSGQVTSVTLLTGGSGYDFGDILGSDGELDNGFFYVNPNPLEDYIVTGINDNGRYTLLSPEVVDSTPEFTVDTVNRTVTGSATISAQIRGYYYNITFELKYKGDSIEVDEVATTVTVDGGYVLASSVVNTAYIFWNGTSWVLLDYDGISRPNQIDIWFSFDKLQYLPTFGPLLVSEIDSSSVKGNLSVNGSLALFGNTSSLTLPNGSIISETANTTVISPPGALPGQSLVIRPTAVQIITSDHPSGFDDGDSVTLTIQPNNGGAVTGTLDYTFTGATAEQLGRALTGTLTFTDQVNETLTWTVPAQSDIDSFTFTLGTPSGFSFGGQGLTYITLSRNGSSEDYHVHLVTGDPATVDLYLGDDDQYVKIEKNGGNVIVGTNTNTNQWRFDTDGNLTLPDDIDPAINYANTRNILSTVVAVGNTAPANRDVWYSTTDGRLYIYNQSTWVDASPAVIPPASTYLGNLEIESTSDSGRKLVILRDADDSTPSINGSAIDYIPTGTLNANDWIGSDSSNPATYPTVTFNNGATRQITGWNTDNYGTSGFLSLDSSIYIANGADTWPITITSYNYSVEQSLIKFGDNTLTVDQSGNLLVNGNLVAGSGTGSITFDGIKVIGANVGNSGIELVPDNTGTFYADGQYISIYPTNGQDVPHIHLDAGSGGDLILGNDQRGVDVNHDANIYIRTDQYLSAHNWRFGSDGNLTLPLGGTLGNIWGDGLGEGIHAGQPSGYVTLAGNNRLNYLSIDNEHIVLQTNVAGYRWDFTGSGNLILPTNGSINFANGVNILSTVGAGTYGNTQVAAYLPTYSGNIAGNIVKNGYTWTFGTTGTLTLPQGGTIDNAPEIVTVTLDQFTDGGYPGTQVFTKVSDTRYELSPGGPYMILISNIWYLKISVSTYYSGTDLITWNAVAGSLPAPVGTLGTVATMNLTVGSNNWTFDNTATLTVPGDIEFTSSTARIGNVDVITTLDHIKSPAYQFANGVNILSTINKVGDITVAGSDITGTGSNVTITADTTDWTFYSNGATVFPGNITVPGDLSTIGGFEFYNGSPLEIVASTLINSVKFLAPYHIEIATSGLPSGFDTLLSTGTWTVTANGTTFTVVSIVLNGESWRIVVAENPNGTISSTATFNRAASGANLVLPPGGNVVTSTGSMYSISLVQLKSIVASSTTWEQFQANIAAL
jgi:hypothetical protein